MSSEQSKPPKRKRRRLQFSLRTMLLLFVVVAVPLSWLAGELKRAADEERAVRSITELGGKVDFSYRATAIGGRKGQPVSYEPPAPEWLQRLLGEYFFKRASQVDFRGPVSDDELDCLDSIRTLEGLVIVGGRITDAGLEKIARRRTLTSLWLEAVDVSDEGIGHLERLHRLECLLLIHVPISDRSLDSFARMSRLEYLQLYDTFVSEEGPGHLLANRDDLVIDFQPALSEAHLRAAVKLEQLGAFVGTYRAGPNRDKLSTSVNVGNTFDATPEDLVLLGDLEGLHTVRLEGGTTNAHLAAIGRLTELESLSFGGRKVTPDGLRHLEGLANLKRLIFSEMEIPAPGLFFSHFPALEELFMFDVEFVDLDPCAIDLSNLRVLVWWESPIPVCALASFADLPALERLDLSASSVGDDDLALISRLVHLKNLDLSGTQITDKGLTHLYGMKDLESISLHDTGISEAGIAQLGKAMSSQPTEIYVRGYMIAEGCARSYEERWENWAASDAEQPPRPDPPD